jgi:integrase
MSDDNKKYTYYDDTHSILNGQIFLYTRKDLKKKKWWMRLNIPLKKGYVVRSTGAYQLHEAQRIAEETYWELKHKVERKLPITRSGFKRIYESFLLEMEKSQYISKHRLRLFKYFGRYWTEYYNTRLIERFEAEDLEQYRIWRMSYWTHGPGLEKDRRANAVDTPSRSTMTMDRQCMLQFLKWCKQKKLIDIVPEYRLPQLKPEDRDTRRPTFTNEEWNILTSKLRWYCESNDAKSKNKLHRWQRTMIRHAILIIANTGLRPQEAAQLKWFQVSYKKNTIDPAKMDTLIHIPPHSKTGERTAVGTEDCYKYFTRLYAISPHTEPHDYVFCSFTGDKQKSWGKTFKTLLRQWGLLEDGFERPRTIYSLRHFYITKRLEAGIPIQLISHICGTSIYNIEKHYYHANIERERSSIAAKTMDQRIAQDVLNMTANKPNRGDS